MNTYKEQVDAKIEERIKKMEQDDYVFPTRFSKKDYVLWSIVVCLSLVIIVLGAGV